MKIVCVMPIFGRPAITIETIKMLKLQSLPFHKIVLIGSTQLDADVAQLCDCTFLLAPNSPLSNKVQAGVYLARRCSPDAIILTGSDSWLTLDYNAACAEKFAQGYQMTGKRQINVVRLYSDEPTQLLSCAYTVRVDPIGAGRAIVAPTLDLLDWQLYPSGLERGLDGASFNMLRQVVKKEELFCFENDCNPAILEVKSNAWQCLTQMQSIICSKTLAIDTVELDWIGDNFPDGLKILKRLVPQAIL